MPPGLIGYRPGAGGRDEGKVGSYKYTGYNQEAALLIVMSVEDPQNVEVAQAYRDRQNQAKWRFLRGALSGDAIALDNSDQSLNLAFKWSDGNGGKVSIHSTGSGTGTNRMVTGAFSRLD